MSDFANPESTRERILDAAEALFAEQGFDATSIRAITAAAGANIASVNYHFQTKDALIHAVLARRLDPVSERRLSLLDKAMGAGKRPAIDDILEAFARPIFEAVFGEDGNPALGRLAGRLTSEPSDSIRKVAAEHIRPVAHRFFEAFALALPGLPKAELLWRVHLSIGAMFHILACSGFIREISNGMFPAPTVETAIHHWTVHTRAALLAPASQGVKRNKSKVAI